MFDLQRGPEYEAFVLFRIMKPTKRSLKPVKLTIVGLTGHTQVSLTDSLQEVRTTSRLLGSSACSLCSRRRLRNAEWRDWSLFTHDITDMRSLQWFRWTSRSCSLLLQQNDIQLLQVLQMKTEASQMFFVKPAQDYLNHFKLFILSSEDWLPRRPSLYPWPSARQGLMFNISSAKTTRTHDCEF